MFFVEESVFINGSGPTKTPEYLAAGKPVISTSIRDVERPYGELNLVSIADSPAEFIRTAQDILARSNEGSDRVTRIDDYLKNLSWDKTWKQMSDLLNDVVVRQRLAQSGPAALSDIGPGVSAARAGIS